MRVAIIGAGLTGLSAARELRRAGLSPVLYDKGRGVGGRLSTRRAEGGLQFDHGAQYLGAKTDGFGAFLQEAERAGAAGRWSMGEGADKIVGIPGMNAIAKYLALGADIRQGVEVSAITADANGWRVAGEHYDRVICTVPAPQAMQLIGAAHPLAEALGAVVMEPNLTLMLALPATTRPFQTRRDPGDDVAWLALDTAKTARPGPECWVAQAGLDWSKAHLERSKEAIATALLPMVCARLGADPDQALYVAAHRWRYAQASVPLGQPYLSASGTLFVGGDWALCDRAEGAWQSGMAMAEAVLATR